MILPLRCPAWTPQETFRRERDHLRGPYLPAVGFTIPQVGDKMLTVSAQKTVWHLLTNLLLCRADDLIHRPWCIFVVQVIVDPIPAVPHHILQAVPSHHGSVAQHTEDAAGAGARVLTWSQRYGHGRGGWVAGEGETGREEGQDEKEEQGRTLLECCCLSFHIGDWRIPRSLFNKL